MQAAERMGDYLDLLNAAQRQAAAFGELDSENTFRAGPLLVIAGAGTGKTMTLAHRVAHLIISGVSPERILLLTFTRRAAQEMTRRVDSIVRQAVAANDSVALPAGVLPWSGTFHSVANRLLRRYALNLSLDPGFSILDRGDSADVLGRGAPRVGVVGKVSAFSKEGYLPRNLFALRQYAKSPLGRCCWRRATPWCSDWASELRELFRMYVARKQQNQALDYDDLLLYWSHLVAEEEFATEIGSWFRSCPWSMNIRIRILSRRRSCEH